MGVWGYAWLAMLALVAAQPLLAEEATVDDARDALSKKERCV